MHANLKTVSLDREATPDPPKKMLFIVRTRSYRSIGAHPPRRSRGCNVVNARLSTRPPAIQHSRTCEQRPIPQLRILWSRWVNLSFSSPRVDFTDRCDTGTMQPMAGSRPRMERDGSHDGTAARRSTLRQPAAPIESKGTGRLQRSRSSSRWVIVSSLSVSPLARENANRRYALRLAYRTEQP